MKHATYEVAHRHARLYYAKNDEVVSKKLRRSTRKSNTPIINDRNN